MNLSFSMTLNDWLPYNMFYDAPLLEKNEGE